MRSKREETILPHPLLIALLVILLVIYLFPILWMYISSARSMSDFVNNPLGLPDSLHFENYRQAFEMANLGHHLLISAFITIISVLCVTVLSSLAAYSFSRLTYAGKNLLYAFFFIGLILPVQSFLVGMFIEFKVLGLLNTLSSVILPLTALSLPLAILLMKAYFDTLPSSLEDSARIEGASTFQIFYYIIMPISTAIVVTVITFTAVNVWNEFLLPFVMIQTENLKPITTSLYVFSTKHSAQLTLKLAALTIIATPMFIVYFVFQKQIQEGITAGALKE
ncbi:MAG TPA: carbohydrate ABC transporter permease [Spirochaetia bacterium]|jgi:raffinose/stachyose/melibiose transport system permease protein|nr:carbohydrate ABC transporter permease [Spirochaetia bacterium]